MKKSPRWAFLSWFTIPDSIDPSVTYLRRLRILQTPWFGVYLHWIYLPDRDRDLHDHPWPFTSVVLRGGYTEEVMQPRVYKSVSVKKTHGRFSAHVMHLDQAHQITRIESGTVTLVLVGKRSRTWGFWTGDGFVPWHDYSNADGTRKAGPDPFDS